MSYEKIDKITQIDPKTIVKVFNNTEGSVGIKTENFSISWDLPDVEKRISFEKLEDALSYSGVSALFDGGKLLIKDNSIRQALFMEPLTKYDLDTEAVIKLLDEGTPEEFEEIIEYCSNDIFDKIVQKILQTGKGDLAKYSIIKKYSNLDLYDILKENGVQETVNSQKQDKPTPKRKPFNK